MDTTLTAATCGELALIERIDAIVSSRCPAATAGIRVGIGDDCAVTGSSDDGSREWLLTSDAVIESVHFDPAADAAAVGHKAIGRCLSDVAAMGGDPRWALVNLVAPAATPLCRIEALMDGLARTAARYEAAVVGGDVAAGAVLEVHVFLVGWAPAGRAVLRSGARPGDIVFVTGRLGGSMAGRHLRFDPRIGEGRWLREGAWVTAMIDVSDGLGLDARRLAAASGCAVQLDAARIPVAEAACQMRDGRSALDHALNDGEDYELLFSVPRDRGNGFESAWQSTDRVACTRIGEMIDGAAGSIRVTDAGGGSVPCLRGYEHFSQ